ncbi:unnamed protein product [Fusarium graminearum]|uniref:Major facilitator superfamily (MFS) profile domain-containing protein n=1 Tax=Gibberella zeae TaxID=5518 RepID=A0A4E9ECA2_GIBZA|nr:unnamed protein product [Fusarium graminearum]CAG2007355.1 unnamed protein product [Fusarium graminearum]CAG2011812.1 unnamed protein product [Fusarium graminearum]
MHSQSADLESSGSAYKATSAYYYVGADIIRTPTRAEVERRLGVSLWCPADQPRGMDCNWAQFTCEFDGIMLDGMQSLALWQEAFGNPTGANLGTLVNTINIAVLVSTTFSSQICETFSRKKPITLGTFLILYDTVVVGYLVAAWTTFSTFKMNSSWSWRLPSLLQGVPAIL